MNASTKKLANWGAPQLLAELGRREQQVARLRAAYAAAMARDGALYWLAEAARQLRVQGGRQMVQVAAVLPVAESTISRFERHHTLPANLDETIAAYANDLDMRPIDIWRYALELWEAADAAEDARFRAAGDAFEEGTRPTDSEAGPPAPPPGDEPDHQGEDPPAGS